MPTSPECLICPYCEYENETEKQFDLSEGEELFHTCESCNNRFHAVAEKELVYITSEVDCHGD